jgi:2-hydroxy-6-oxonona-2,4-dienedioate hydrolase/4,5:9,10-diseco-3-hydroxy-5,9,17-trioxoandrosta-1(10),2-diene-4-oate hydrolase
VAEPLTERATERFLTATGVRLRYHEAGAGEPLVLLHGGGPGASGWSNYHRNIDALSREYRVLIPDLPGFGGSDKCLPDRGLFGYLAGVIRDFLDALAIPTAHFVGNSLGGGTVLKLALEHPKRLGKGVLMGSGGGLPMFSTMPTEGVRHLVGYYEGTGPSLEKLRSFIDVMLYDGSAVTDELLEQRYRASLDPDIVRNPPIKRLAGKLPLEELWREELPRLDHELLLVWGREDRVVPLDCAFVLLKQLARGQLHVFGQYGHWVQWEKATAFNALVLGFLKHA